MWQMSRCLVAVFLRAVKGELCHLYEIIRSSSQNKRRGRCWRTRSDFKAPLRIALVLGLTISGQLAATHRF
jgi:hypothetical protein